MPEYATHPFSDEFVEVVARHYFVVDGNARYVVRELADGFVTAESGRGVVYVSKETDLQITGAVHKQPGTGGCTGRRARLHLDTGEGLSVLSGYVAA